MQTATAIRPPTAAWDPYLADHQPPSRDFVLLSRALETIASVEWGMSGSEIANAFSAVSNDPADRERILVTVRMLASLILAGDLDTQARPFGGGRSRPIPWSDWEIDDPLPRFAWSAMDPERPFVADADPTHWIMVPRIQLESIAEALCSESLTHHPSRSLKSSAEPRGTLVEPVPPSTGPSTFALASRLLGRAEVMQRTSLSKSTLYDKIERGTFPRQIQLGARKSVWREDEVEAWIADPR